MPPTKSIQFHCWPHKVSFPLNNGLSSLNVNRGIVIFIKITWIVYFLSKNAEKTIENVGIRKNNS